MFWIILGFLAFTQLGRLLSGLAAIGLFQILFSPIGAFGLYLIAIHLLF